MLRSLFLLAGPTVIEQALQTVVQYADTAMVGQIGAQASAAVGLTITVTWLVNSPLFAMGVGVLALIAKSIGENNLEKARAADLHQAVSLPESLEAPVSAGDVIGTLVITDGAGETAAELPLLAGEDVPRITFGQMLLRVLRTAFLSF